MIDSLRFLTDESITRRLTRLDLRLFEPCLQLAELQYVFELTALEDLWIADVFDRPLDGAELYTAQSSSDALPDALPSLLAVASRGRAGAEHAEQM